MTTKLIKLTLSIIIILTITACSNVNQSYAQAESIQQDPLQKYLTIYHAPIKFIYTIAEVSNNVYYGTDSKGNGIYFTQSNIKSNQEINVNDNIVAFFSHDNLIDGLIKVEKGIQAEDGSFVPESFFQ